MDTVQFGSVTVTSQAIQAATTVTENFVKNSAVDCLFGLDYAKYNSILPERTETWFANAMKTLKSGVFTADLRPGACQRLYIRIHNLPASPQHLRIKGLVDSRRCKGLQDW